MNNNLDAGVRKVHKVGGSLMIALPPSFIEVNGIKDGDELAVISHDEEVRILPGPGHNIHRFFGKSRIKPEPVAAEVMGSDNPQSPFHHEPNEPINNEIVD